MRVAAQAATSALWFTCLLLASCGPKGIESFSVVPADVCSGKSVTITWRVDGAAQLEASPTPVNWNEQIPSEGSRIVLVGAGGSGSALAGATAGSGGAPASIQTDTSFTLRAPQANPAKGHATATQPVHVLAGSEQRAAAATCDEAKKCSGTIQFAMSDSARVRTVLNPSWKSGMKSSPHAVCVTSPAGQRVCLDANASAPLNALANGTWTLETTLSADESGDPPPELRVVFDFGCG